MQPSASDFAQKQFNSGGGRRTPDVVRQAFFGRSHCPHGSNSYHHRVHCQPLFRLGFQIVIGRTFGELVRERRLSEIDEVTRKPLTQARLTELINSISPEPISRSWVREVEAGRIRNPRPSVVLALSQVLRIESPQALMALGFPTAIQPLREDERDLLAAYRSIRDDDDRYAALRAVQGIAGLRPPQPRTRPDGHPDN
jgi:transcriptional regulator with XRE-family HTH domain